MHNWRMQNPEPENMIGQRCDRNLLVGSLRVVRAMVPNEALDMHPYWPQKA